MIVWTDWHGLYWKSWKGTIVDEAFEHPAKFSRALIEHIYRHLVVEMGWLQPGDTVLDPFAGVASGALDALYYGLHWHGVELEEKFVTLGQANIDLWNKRYSEGMGGWGTTVLVQGDSRYLVGAPAEGVVTSPPYESGCRHTGGDDPKPGHIKGGTYHGIGIYGSVSSPPWGRGAEGGVREGKFKDPEEFAREMSERDIGKRHGTTPESRAAQMERDAARTYGDTPGNLGQMKGSVSSPPYEGSTTEPTKLGKGRPTRATGEPADRNKGDYHYSDDPDNLGNERGETFWSAARMVVQGVYDLLAPGGHAVWVVKDFVRKGQIVPFTEQWRELCESVGFETLHGHRAWLVQERGVQRGFWEDVDKGRARKSFFRRLAESKGSPPIDWEVVWCMVKC